MNKSSSVATQKPTSSTSAWANGPPALQQQIPPATARHPSSATTPTHSRKSSILSQAAPFKDGVSVPRGIPATTSSNRHSGINFGTIDANGPVGPAATAGTPPAVNGSAGTPPPSSKDAQALLAQPKAFGSLPAQSNTPSTTVAPSPTPSNASTAAASSSAAAAATPPVKRKLDANKFFQAPTSSQPQPSIVPQQAQQSSHAPPNSAPIPPTVVPPQPNPSAVPPSFHPNAPNTSVMAAANNNVAVNSPSQRFQTLPPPANHGYYPHHPSPQLAAAQQPIIPGQPPNQHLRPGGGIQAPRSPSFSSRPPINGAGPPNVNGANAGGPRSATGQPTGTVPQVGSPRLGNQGPAMQQQAPPPGGPVVPPPGQAPYPPQAMQMGWQQPPYGGWQQHQYAQYPYMATPEWYGHMQHPHMHQHPHQPPYIQPPGTPHSGYPSPLPHAAQPPTTASTMSPRIGGNMPNLPPQNAGAPPPPPQAQAPPRPLSTSLTVNAKEFVPTGVMGGSSPLSPSPGFPLPKKAAIKISNPTTGQPVVLRPPDGGHARTMSRDTAVVHESSPLKKPPIRMESPEDKRAREEKERREREEKVRKEEEEKKRKEEEEERKKKEEEERVKREEEERVKREEEERIRAEEEKKRIEEEAARKKKEEEERVQREKEEAERKEREEQERKEREEQERKDREERERKEREEAEAKAEAERIKKEAEDARLAAEAEAAAKAKAEAEAKEREEKEKEKLQAPALSRTASASSVTASPKLGSSSLPAKPSLPPISTGDNRPKMQRPVPGPLDLSSTQRPPMTPGLPSALASARKIDDLDSVTYPEGIRTPSIELNQGQMKGGKYKYDRDFLLQFMQICKDKPDNLSSLDSLGIERGPGDDNNAPSFGSGGRAQGRRMGSMGPPGGGSGARAASMNVGLGLTGFPGGKGGSGFVGMGNFQSTPSRMTSEERFAASNRDRAVSGGPTFMRGVPMSRSSSQGGVGGIGPNAVPQSPREPSGRVRSQRGRARNDSLKPNAPQSGQQQQQQQALSGFEPVAPLQSSENRWAPSSIGRKPAVDESSPEFVERKVKGLLNKLTLENFESVSNQIIQYANKSESEKNGATLILVIKLVFEKATDEAHWSEMYARLCRKMMEQISNNVQDDNIRNTQGEPIVGGHLFRKYLLNRCQEDFERGWSQKESAQAAAALKAETDKAAAEAAAASKADGGNDEPVLYSDEYYALLKAKRQGLGLVRFIGELFKLQMLTERIMHECIKKLLSKIDNPEEEEIESLCKLLTTVGQALDTQKAKGHMDIYFGRMQMLADNPTVASRIRYMLLDVIELRGRAWKPRTAHAGPSTLAQVHEQAVKEQQAAAQQTAKMVPMSRTGSQRGSRAAPEQGPDGWNVAGPTPVRAPAKAGDLSNFGKFSSNAGPLKTMGPSSVFKKGDRGRDTPPPGAPSSISRATSGSNMFSLLGSGGADAVDTMPKRTPSGRGTTRKPSVDQVPQAVPDTPMRRKLNLLPRTQSATASEDGGAGDDKPESDEEQATAAPTKSYSEKEAKQKVEEDVKEFFNIRDVSEGEKSFAELPDEHKHKLVDKLAGKVLDMKETDVKLVAELFERVSGKACSLSAFEEGLGSVIEFLDDMVIDVPQAYTHMARLLRGSQLPRETVESLGDKIFVDSEPVVKPRDKLLKAYDALA